MSNKHGEIKATNYMNYDPVTTQNELNELIAENPQYFSNLGSDYGVDISSLKNHSPLSKQDIYNTAGIERDALQVSAPSSLQTGVSSGKEVSSADVQHIQASGESLKEQKQNRGFRVS